MDIGYLELGIAFLVQLLVTCGAVIVAVRVGLAKLEVRVEDVACDMKRIEQKVDQINGNVRAHDREIVGLQKDIEILSRPNPT